MERGLLMERLWVHMNFSKSGVDSYETEDFKDISYDFFIKEEKNDENKRIYL